MRTYDLLLISKKTGKVRERIGLFVRGGRLLPGATYNGNMGVRPEIVERKPMSPLSIKSSK